VCASCKLASDLLTLKVVSESRVTCATSVPSLVFLGLSVLDLGTMYATERQTSNVHHRLMPSTLGKVNGATPRRGIGVGAHVPVIGR